MARDLKKIRRLLDEALTYERLDEAKALAEEGYRIARYKEVLYEMEYFRGEADLIEGRRRKAIRHFDMAIGFNPKDGESYNDKAIALAELGRLDEAMECIDKGLEAVPRYATLYHNKAWILTQEDRLKEAIYFHKKALALDDRRAVTYISLGDIYALLGDYDNSVRNFKRALGLIPRRYRDVKGEVLKRLRQTEKRRGEAEI